MCGSVPQIYSAAREVNIRPSFPCASRGKISRNIISIPYANCIDLSSTLPIISPPSQENDLHERDVLKHSRMMFHERPIRLQYQLNKILPLAPPRATCSGDTPNRDDKFRCIRFLPSTINESKTKNLSCSVPSSNISFTISPSNIVSRWNLSFR